MVRFSFLALAFAGLTAAPGSAPEGGLTIVLSESFPAGTKETTEYVAVDRARVEWRISSRTHEQPAQPQDFVQIRRCDLDTLTVLNVGAATYHSEPLGAHLTRLERALLLFGRRERESRAPDIVVETNTVDTGERRVAFGHSARRVVTTRRQFLASTPDAADETVTDGWYIDLDTRVSCERAERSRAVLIAVAAPSNTREDSPRIAFRDIGSPEEGFPIETTTTFNAAEGRKLRQIPPTVTRSVVTRLSREPLEASLFEVPPGFRCEDGRFSSLTAGWTRKGHILRSVVASWFR